MAVPQLCLGLNPDCVCGSMSYLFISCSTTLSKTLEMVGKMVIGRKSDTLSKGFVFGIGSTNPSFHDSGKTEFIKQWLIICVMYGIRKGHINCKSFILIPSEPHAF